MVACHSLMTMAKLNADKIKEAEAWVERNGLHPQACGATFRLFFEAMGIDQRTYYRWLKNADFAEALTRGREKFRITTVRDVENSLVKAAKGYEFVKSHAKRQSRKVREYDPKTGKKVREYYGEPQLVEEYREVVTVQPSIEAAKFVLTNMEPEKWKNRQDTRIDGRLNLLESVVVNNEEEKAMIKGLQDSGL